MINPFRIAILLASAPWAYFSLVGVVVSFAGGANLLMGVSLAAVVSGWLWFAYDTFKR